jgi:hypothetical protein
VTPYEPVRWKPRLFTRFLPTLIIIAILGIIAAIGLGGNFSPKASDPPLPASPIDGVVVSVDALTLTEVLSFQIRTVSGTVFELAVGTLENATEFSPSHLAEHQATSVPIRAYYRLENDIPVVYRLEDAPAGTASPPG